MSDPMNREILDVLSSIRRLVSEDRKVAPAPTPAPQPPGDTSEPERPSALPRDSRFVLTAALRVADPAQSESDAEGDAALSAAEEAWASDAEAGDASDEADLAEFAHGGLRDENAAPPPVATLESTIAELEAAVAGIEAEFEPDGSEEVATAPEAIPERLWTEELMAPQPVPAFGGIIADFDPISRPDERLDAPITGEVMYTEPPQPFADARADTPPVDKQQVLVADGDDADAQLVEMNAAALAGGEDESEAVADMMPEDSLMASGPAPDDRDEAAAPERDNDAGAMPAVAARLHLAGDAVTRLRIFRPEAAEPAVAQGGGLADETPALTGEDDGTDEADDLLDPLAAADLDIERLRDIVVEIIRDELRGTLGERITRNLRALVRREIARALEAAPEADR